MFGWSKDSMVSTRIGYRQLFLRASQRPCSLSVGNTGTLFPTLRKAMSIHGRLLSRTKDALCGCRQLSLPKEGEPCRSKQDDEFSWQPPRFCSPPPVDAPWVSRRDLVYPTRRPGSSKQLVNSLLDLSGVPHRLPYCEGSEGQPAGWRRASAALRFESRFSSGRIHLRQGTSSLKRRRRARVSRCPTARLWAVRHRGSFPTARAWTYTNRLRTDDGGQPGRVKTHRRCARQAVYGSQGLRAESKERILGARRRR